MATPAEETNRRASAQPAVERDHRSLPNLGYLFKVVRRNLIIGVIVATIIAPFVIFAVVGASKTYVSSVLIKFNPEDYLDQDARQFATPRYGALWALLRQESEDMDYFRELAERYQPEDGESKLSNVKLPAPLKLLLAKPATKAPVDDRAKALRDSLIANAELTLQSSFLLRLEAKASSPENARKLVETAADLLIERYFRQELRGVSANYESLTAFLDHDDIKALLKEAKESELAAARDVASSTDDAKSARERQQEARRRREVFQERVRDVRSRIAYTRERKAKLEAEMLELSQRYGPFHPRIQTLSSEIAAFKDENKEQVLSKELRSLEERIIALDGEGPASEGFSREAESITATIKRLSTRQERLKVERLNLQRQLQNPADRVRLAIFGAPVLQTEAAVNPRKKIAIMGLVAVIALTVAFALAREVFAKQVIDGWRVSWRYNLPCLALLPRKIVAEDQRLTPEAIGDMRQKIGDDKRERKKFLKLNSYRDLSHWLHAGTSGKIVLVAKASDRALVAPFLGNLLNFHATDYAGRFLLVDLDARDPVARDQARQASAHLFDFLELKAPWSKVCRKAEPGRGFDLVTAPPRDDARLPVLLSSRRFEEFLKLASKMYQLIVINGLGPDLFLENCTIMEQASDCLIIVEQGSTRFERMDALVRHLPREKIGGYVYLEA